ncbi:MAG: nuclear transport factor 2 family protein [Opitutaceae bacterium]|nr:nuclear transport factor 2 family protein [Cytophagales bacterium]
MKETDIKTIIKQFIKATNSFDVETALKLFSLNAVIDDVSVGEKFKSTVGVRKYLETYFVDYKTRTKLESIEVHDNLDAKAQVDFTGDFGHETGGLNFTLNNEGLITEIRAYLD